MQFGNFYVDATKIAMEVLKNNITNSTMLGALSKVTDLYSLEEIKVYQQKYNEAEIERHLNS